MASPWLAPAVDVHGELAVANALHGLLLFGFALAPCFQCEIDALAFNGHDAIAVGDDDVTWPDHYSADIDGDLQVALLVLHRAEYAGAAGEYREADARDLL